MTDHQPPPAVEAIGRLEELARAATPGPWRWEVSLSSKRVELCGGPPNSGFGAYDHSVMSFARWGLNGAAPVFWSWEGHFGTPKRADEVAVPVEGREHHASWFRQPDDPNAAYIAAANPQAILSLIESLRHSVEREAGLREALAKERRLDAVTGRVVEAAIEEAEGYGTQNDALAAAVEAYQRATGAWDEARDTRAALDRRAGT